MTYENVWVIGILHVAWVLGSWVRVGRLPYRSSPDHQEHEPYAIDL